MSTKVEIIDEAIVMANIVYLKYHEIFNGPEEYRSDLLLVNIVYSEDIFMENFPFPGDLCGMLCMDEFENTIVYNSNHSQARRNFTIGHELGHFFLHKDKQSQFTDRSKNLLDNTNNEFEIQANAFASHLLLPENVLSFLLLKQHLNFYKISKQSMISNEALYWRLITYLIDTVGLSRKVAIIVVDDFKDFSTASINNLINHKFALIYSINRNNYEEKIDNRINKGVPVKFIKNENGKVIRIDGWRDYGYEKYFYSK